jgi:DNA-binding SARP family transcriptional activator/class 3 adenylate cyclase
MEFRILGPLEALSDGEVLELVGPKQRALSALLLIERNRVVSSDRLIEALWEGAPPPTAQKALQMHVSHLRKVLGRDRVQTKEPGYVLRIEDGELDADRFRVLVAEERFDEALALWRGPALADFAYQGFAQAEIARLEELRLVCLEERVDRELAAGRHAEAVGDLDALIREHPLRERLRAQLLLALYRCGRQADALAAYQDARRALVDELGIEPGRALRELHQAILSQDPALELPGEERPARAPPPPVPPEPAADDVRKTVTAVSVRLAIAGTGGDQLDPEALRAILDRAFAKIERALEHHGGTVTALGGEEITATFGLPVVHEDDALRALRAAGEVRDALSALAGELSAQRAVELDFGVGISTGEVIVGGEHRRATGQPLSSSSRLGRTAAAGEIVLDDATRWLVRARGRRLYSPMVGRERERRRLQDAFEQAAGDRSCQLFTVLGPAGVGKSRLVREFVATLPDDALVVRGRCLPYGDGITFWPLLEAVRQAVGLEDGDPPEAALAKLARALTAEPDADRAARQVAELIGIAEASAGVDDAFDAVGALVGGLARSRPVVAVFDDIHWGEATFLDLLEHLADTLRDAPVLLLCLARPELHELRPGWAGGKLNATSVLLEPLSEQECARLIDNLVGQADLSSEVDRRIAELAEGNPLFVEELLSMLIDDGLLVQRDGSWAATGDIAAVRVPPTIHALLGARLDRLAAGERAVIERAAVEGKVFHEGVVIRLAPEALRPAVTQHLDALVRKELIRPARAELRGERAFRFRHLLIRDAAYDAIPKASRAELHERFGRGLGERTEYEEIVGYHLEQAYRYRAELGPLDEPSRALGREAAERLGAAGSRAFMRRDRQAAVSLIARAVSMLAADDPARVDLIPNVRVVQGISGDLGWADAVLTEATAAGDERVQARALVQRGFLRLFTEPGTVADEVVGDGERALAVFERLGDELGLARAWRLIAQAHYAARRAAPSADASERALVHVRRTGKRIAEEHETVEWLAVALFAGPTPAPKAMRRCERLLEQVAGDPALDVLVTIVLANLTALTGHVAKARELMDRARRLRDERVERIWFFPMNFVPLILLDDEPAAAERELRWGYDELRRSGESSHFSTVAAMLARAMCAQGRYDESQSISRESEVAAGPNDVHSQILWRTTRGLSLARSGELEAAEPLVREAVAFAAQSDFSLYHGDALVDLAEVLERAGRHGEAASAFAAALELYADKESVASTERAHRRII